MRNPTLEKEMLTIQLWVIICSFGNLSTAKKYFVFVKCIYFFINYMNIVWIHVLLTLEPISLSPIFEVAGKGRVQTVIFRYSKITNFRYFIGFFVLFPVTVE